MAFSIIQGQVQVLDNNTGLALDVEVGVAIPAGTRSFIVAGSDGTNARYIRLAADGTLRIDPTGTTTQPVSGTFWQATQPVSAVSLPLPTGASTEATLALIKAKTDNLDVALSTRAVTGLTDTELRATAVPVSGTFFQATQPVSGTVTANQGGTWNINNISGVISLPTGASTSALQTTGNTSLSNIDTKLPAALVGGRLDVNTGAWLGSTTPTVGQKTMAASIPVTLSSDQTVIAVSSAPGSATLAGFARGDITTAAIALVAVRRTTYTEQTANAQRSIVSTSAADTSAGTGARTVKLTYLTVTGTGPFTETLTLNGTTAVNTVATDICFIEKIEVLTAGSGLTNAGTINFKAATAGGGATVWSIAIGDIETFGCHHYVPVSKTAHITAQWAGHTGTTVGSGATFTIRALPINVANAVERVVSDNFRLYGQSSSVQRNYGSAILVAGPARLLTYVLPETSTSVNYRASFDLYED